LSGMGRCNKTAADARGMRLHCARVYLAESHRRAKTPFAHTLLQWAGNFEVRHPMPTTQGKIMIFRIVSITACID